MIRTQGEFDKQMTIQLERFRADAATADALAAQAAAAGVAPPLAAIEAEIAATNRRWIAELEPLISKLG